MANIIEIDNAFDLAWKYECKVCKKGVKHLFFHDHIKNYKSKYMGKIINYNSWDPYYYPTIEQMVDGFHYQYMFYEKRTKYKDNCAEEVIYDFTNYTVGTARDVKREYYQSYIDKGYIRAIRLEALVYVKINSSYVSNDDNIGVLNFGIRLMNYSSYLLEFKYNGKDKISFIGVVDKKVKELTDKGLLYYYQLGKSDDDNTGVKCSISSPRFIITLGTKSNYSIDGYKQIINQLETKRDYKGSRNLLEIDNKLYRLVSGGYKVDLENNNPYIYSMCKEDIVFLIDDERLKFKIESELILPYKSCFIKFMDLETIRKAKQLKKEVISNFKISSYTMNERIKHLRKYKYAA